MIQFKKLKLTGFKSFVDSTEIPVELGLTGIVGPNGCGKSNLVEAMRWVMGETSAKQMRGSEMEDVIFGGTASRPARNTAEVLLHLDNRTRSAPAQFNDFDELDVSRTIERDKGSTYRVNGKEVRARDVQLLFADAATGARSTALVSQGRIGQIISQKPVDRRHLLEEAAGITGLHSRRHEAELRLRGAETNLERLDDILGTLDVQLQALKKQARQATRYRNLSDHIRKAEATMYHVRWVEAEAALQSSREALQDIEDKVNELTRAAASANLAETKAAEQLPELRKGEAEAAAALQRLIIARDGLQEEEARLSREAHAITERLAQIAADLEREQSRQTDAAEAIERLAGEQQRLETERDESGDALTEAAAAVKEIDTQVSSLDQRNTALTEELAAEEARISGLQRTVAELREQIERLDRRLAESEDHRRQLLALSGETRELDEAECDAAKAEQELAAAREAVAIADESREKASGDLDAARERDNQARDAMTGLTAEEKALADLLETDEPEMFSPLIDAVSVDAGFEGALGAALGDDLSAPADEPATVHWRTLDAIAASAALPAGATPLSAHVKAPKALARRLSQIGIVPDIDTGKRLQPELREGQRLVSRDGWLWRWDGFTVSPDAATGAAKRLEQRNRLDEVRREISGLRKNAEAASSDAKIARETLEAAERSLREARNAVDSADHRLNAARERRSACKEQAAARSSRIAALDEQIEGLRSDRGDAARRLEESEQALAEAPATEERRNELATLRVELEEARTRQTDIRSRHASLARAADERERRLTLLESEIESWRNRSGDAAGQIEQLETRQTSLTEERSRLADLPAEIERKRFDITEKLENAERVRREAADKLSEMEQTARTLNQAAREAEAALADAREGRARAEGLVDQHRQALGSIRERVADTLSAEPGQLAQIAEIAEDAHLPDIEATERRVERLHRERDNMGPVNLRADQEAEELGEQIDTLGSERDDLLKAIDKLRKGISELNREGRERLLLAFNEVNEHFQELFVKLFGGGSAHLTLTESDDPLEAGLEIMASPPGKKLQVLSLLSGGEQALTALSLLFAVFMTNPAPICVLDEVDAPLDDANVDRFCTLLELISQDTGTRFVVITHHRMTMARMDRLFGVTMTERGVSKLVSVDLKQAEAMRATA
ncbi:MAG: chromosome segregation protein SMC [Rhodospirillales bacterium]